MLHHVSVKYHFTICDASLCFFYAEMRLFGSHRSTVHYFHVFFQII